MRAYSFLILTLILAGCAHQPRKPDPTLSVQNVEPLPMVQLAPTESSEPTPINGLPAEFQWIESLQDPGCPD